MAMTIEDQGKHDIVGFLWENQSRGFSNFDNSGEIKEKLVIEKSSHQEEGNEGELFMSKKRSREIVCRSVKKVNIRAAKEKDGNSRKVDHEMHILNERERRKKIRNLFDNLHALLPQLPSKVDKLTIIDQAMDYIKYLKHTLEKLEKQKQEKLQSVSTFRCEPSVINSHSYPIDSNETFIIDHGSFNNFTNAIGNQNPSNSTAISVPQQPLAFQIWSSPNVVLNICGKEAQFCIFTSRKPGLLTAIAFVLEKLKIDVIYANIMCDGNGNRYMIQTHANRTTYQLILESTSVEEIYKQAAREIMQWIS